MAKYFEVGVEVVEVRSCLPTISRDLMGGGGGGGGKGSQGKKSKGKW